MTCIYPPQRDQSCINCCYFVEQQCRRHAPLPRNREYIDGLPMGQFIGIWPEVDACDWCGDWGPLEL